MWKYYGTKSTYFDKEAQKSIFETVIPGVGLGFHWEVESLHRNIKNKIFKKNSQNSIDKKSCNSV